MERTWGTDERGVDDRAQTLLDYLIGITVLLLVVAGTFATFPGLTAPFDDPVSPEDRQMAERLADATVAWNSSTAGAQTVHYSALVETLDSASSFAALTRSAGIPESKLVNVTLASEGDVKAAAGSTFRDDPAATTVRIVSTHETAVCTPSCRLIVRVW